MIANNNKDIFSLKPSEGLQQRLHIDFPLFLAFMVIFMISLTTIYSASNASIDAVLNQGIKINILGDITKLSPDLKKILTIAILHVVLQYTKFKLVWYESINY